VDEVQASRRPGGAVHRGMVWLLRHQARWLVELLAARRFLPRGPFTIEVIPTETWPVGEENRGREIRADVVLRLWPGPVPEDPSLEVIRASHVIGLILDFQERRDQDKELRVLEYDSAYPPVLGPHIHMVVLTLHEAVARWMQRVFAGKDLSMQTCVISAQMIPRCGPIDAALAPRRALLEAMLHVRSEADLSLLTNALRALRHFEANELLIYREMLLNQMERSLIMKAQRELEPEDDDPQWANYVPTKRERASFMFCCGAEEGRKEGREEGRKEGREEGRALAVLDLLRIRGVEVDAESETRIRACRDDDQLLAWLARAATLARIDELFEPR
jgi:hypothetical protein